MEGWAEDNGYIKEFNAITKNDFAKVLRAIDKLAPMFNADSGAYQKEIDGLMVLIRSFV